MKEYQKINTIFKRDVNNIIMPYAGLVKPELEWLRNCKFDATEKIDGTNISLQLVPQLHYGDYCTYVEYSLEYHGKTANANIPAHLLEYLKENYTEEMVLKALGVEKKIVFDIDEHVFLDKYPIYAIYGEGYGVKIQKGGNYIKDGVGFIIFDVKVGDWWLKRENMEDVAAKLGAPVVPYMGQFTIDEAIEFVKKGFKSTIAENKDYDAEGLVLKSPCGILFRNGERICFKVKTCDFVKYKNKYGDGIVAQEENPKYV